MAITCRKHLGAVFVFPRTCNSCNFESVWRHCEVSNSCNFDSVWRHYEVRGYLALNLELPCAFMICVIDSWWIRVSAVFYRYCLDCEPEVRWSNTVDDLVGTMRYVVSLYLKNIYLLHRSTYSMWKSKPAKCKINFLINLLLF
jgi:hypothetical protein